MLPDTLDLATLQVLYADGLDPRGAMDGLARRMAAATDPAIFITAVDQDGLRRQIDDLLRRAPEPNSLPLWGIPFAVKDNIDVGGLPTTAGCPAFAYVPERDAFVVSRLKAAGAIVTGKTNLDQFATGLNGTRSPYGAPRCVFDAAYISGGSSSGSAVAVAAGLASFALGTDTAGSGRVPAALNNIVGVKPTPGRISASGLVPACRSVDTITIFAGCVGDAVRVRRIAEGFDPADPFSRLGELSFLPSRPRVGVLRDEDREFFGDAAAARLYDEAIDRIAALGATPIPFDFAPLREAAALLYDGPWVAERLAALETFLRDHAEAFDPSVLAIVEGARRFSAVDTFRGSYQLAQLRRRAETIWAACEVLLLPTVPTTFTVEAMRADPIRLNSRLGLYTNFANLLGLAAIAIPAGFKPDGLPFGVTLVGPGASDDTLGLLADAVHRAATCGMGRSKAPVRSAPPPVIGDRIEIVVVGAHLSGLPLNRQLTELGAELRCAKRTTPDYRLYALPDWSPPKPGLVRDPGYDGPGIDVEVWSLSPEGFGVFVSTIPSPLGIAKIALCDGTEASGFLCESWATKAAMEITAYGGWRQYLART